MWRDRTNLYISYRQSYAHHPSTTTRHKPSPFASSRDEDRQGLLSPGSDDDTVIEMDLLPPRFTDVSDEVNEILARIAKASALLDKLHQKHVLPGFDDNRNKEEAEIERLTTEITASFHTCQNKIRQIEKMAAGGSSAEVAMGRNIQVSLAAKVQEASTKFRKKQSAYLKKLRGLNGMSTPVGYRSSSPALPDDDISYSHSALQQSSVLTSNDAAIQQREREITDIAKGILELADIFKELQTMVIDQGTMLDRIDYNVERLNMHVKAADKEMDIAQGYQKKYTKRKVIFLLILCVVGMAILVGVKPRGKDSQAVPSGKDIEVAKPPPAGQEKPAQADAQGGEMGIPKGETPESIGTMPEGEWEEAEFGIPSGEVPQGATEGNFGQAGQPGVGGKGPKARKRRG